MVKLLLIETGLQKLNLKTELILLLRLLKEETVYQVQIINVIDLTEMVKQLYI